MSIDNIVRVLKTLDVRFVTNHWGWTPRGIGSWIWYGWGFFSQWGIEELPPKRDRRCMKLGPIAWNWEAS